MTHETITWIWIIGGIVLMVLELLVPGLIIVFFGAAALLVGLLNWLGFIESLSTSFGIWIALSLVLVVIFRNFAVKLFPSESNYQLVEEDVDAIGSIVEVVSTVHEDNNSGRIMYNGTSWQAVSNNGTIEKGQKAKLVHRDNISWIVVPFEED